MPARGRSLPNPVLPGAPPAETVNAALTILNWFRGVDFDKAESMLRAVESAQRANEEALTAWGPASEIAKLAEAAELDRAEASKELTAARTEAKRIVAESEARLRARSNELNEQVRQLDTDRRALAEAEVDFEDRVKALEQQTSALRAALA